MEDKIGELVSVLGVDSQVAKSLLEASGGNLEMAVNMHLEGGSPVSSFGVGDYGKSYEEIHGVRAPIPQMQGVLIEDQPLHSKGKILRSRKLPQTVYDPSQDYSSQVNSKTKELAKLFEPPLDLMFQGSFDEARHIGREQQKWLLVNIQDSKEFASQVLNRDLWKNSDVKSIVKKHFIFWQVQRITDGGARFKQLYHITTFPCIAVIDPRTGEKLACWNALGIAEFTHAVQEFLSVHNMDTVGGADSKTIVDECEQSQLEAAIRASLVETQAEKSYQLIDSDDQCTPVASGDESNDEVCVRRRAGPAGGRRPKGSKCIDSTSSDDERVPSPFSHHSPSDISFDPIDDQSASVNHTGHGRKRRRSFETNGDVPRKLLKKIVSSRLDDATPLQHQSEIRRKGKEKAGSVGVASKVKDLSLPGETPDKQLVPGMVIANDITVLGMVSANDITVLLVRLPDGTRVEKSFNCTHPIQELSDFLSGHHCMDSKSYEVVTHFPKQQISSLPSSTTFKEAGLYPRATVFVQRIDE